MCVAVGSVLRVNEDEIDNEALLVLEALCVLDGVGPLLERLLLS